MTHHRLAKTANRSVVGVMNEFAHLADHHRANRGVDLDDLNAWLAQVPCSPLYLTHVSPDRALAARVAALEAD